MWPLSHLSPCLCKDLFLSVWRRKQRVLDCPVLTEWPFSPLSVLMAPWFNSFKSSAQWGAESFLLIYFLNMWPGIHVVIGFPLRT